MFLNDTHIQSTYMKESVGLNGQKETVLVINMDSEPEILRGQNPKHYKHLSDNLSYLNSLASQGFLDFDRIEVMTPPVKEMH